MKIGIVLYKFGSEEDFGSHLGSFHYLVKKIKRLGETEHQIYVIAPWVSFWRRGSSRLGNVTIIRYWPPLFSNVKLLPLHWLLRWLYLRQTQRVVLRSVRKHKLQAVYVRQARETGYAVALIKEKLGVPFLFRQITAWQWHFHRPVAEVLAHAPLYQWLKKLGWHKLAESLLERLLGRRSQIRYAKKIYQQADRLVFSTRGAALAEASLGLDMRKVVLLPEAVEEDTYAPRPDRAALGQSLGLQEGNVILYLGRINIAEKGIDRLLRASALVAKQIPTIQVVLVGGGLAHEVSQVKRLIAELGAEKFVSLVGKRPFSDVPRYINAATVVVVPSVWPEAFGRITVEAMSCGVPVITSDTGGSPEVNVQGQTGLVVPAADSQQLADAIIAILNDKTRAAAMGVAGRQRVLANYTYEQVIKRFLDIITSAVESNFK